MKIKYIEDYFPQIKERYPEVETWEIQRILEHGFRSLYTVINYGADVNIRGAHNLFNIYFGKLYANKGLATYYYQIKKRIKARIQYHHKKPVWDGNYYFGLTEEDYIKYFKDKKGRIKKKITFENLKAFKIKDEAFINWKHKYFIELSGQEDEGFVFKRDKFTTRDVKLIAVKKDGKIEYYG